MHSAPDPAGESIVVVGLDNGGTCNNATVLHPKGFLVDELIETPSLVKQGPEAALYELVFAFENVLARTSTDPDEVQVVGLASPGPASADGVISERGSTNFEHPDWCGFDLRGALESKLGRRVAYINDGNAAALYAHHRHFGARAQEHSSVSLVIGTGLGGGLVHRGRVVTGAAGMAGELGHVHIPLEGLLESDQPVPYCNCGFVADAESVASLTGIENNLLPYWLTRFPGHELSDLASPAEASRAVRSYGEAGDDMALRIFTQQAKAIGRLLTIVANVLDPDAYFIGGGVVETSEQFRTWYLQVARENTTLRAESARVATFHLVPDLDMAGARGAALAALDAVRF
jgi:predicted NBD/HSP70 family sugar kinase